MGAPKNSIDIAICTFRRDHITRTLESLNALTGLDDHTVRILVADNDETPSAKERVEEAAAALRFPVHYMHAPSRNISIARNACLDAATASYLAFIDDDEWVDTHWLSAMLDTMAESKADIVLGPVTAHYAPEFPKWVIKGDFHATRPVWVKDTITTGYTCNVLFNRESTAIKDLRFDLSLGRSGGEDTAFFHLAHQAGATIAYASDGMVHEDVPPQRATLKWLLKRRFRSGQSHASIVLGAQHLGPNARIKHTIIACTKLNYCSWMALFCFLQPVEWRYWLLRGTLHAGVISRLLGKHEIEQYG